MRRRCSNARRRCNLPAVAMRYLANIAGRDASMGAPGHRCGIAHRRVYPAFAITMAKDGFLAGFGGARSGPSGPVRRHCQCRRRAVLVAKGSPPPAALPRIPRSVGPGNKPGEQSVACLRAQAVGWTPGRKNGDMLVSLSSAVRCSICAQQTVGASSNIALVAAWVSYYCS